MTNNERPMAAGGRELPPRLTPPLYTRQNVRVVHRLRYDWTGWLATASPPPGLSASPPPDPADASPPPGPADASPPPGSADAPPPPGSADAPPPPGPADTPPPPDPADTPPPPGLSRWGDDPGIRGQTAPAFSTDRPKTLPSFSDNHDGTPFPPTLAAAVAACAPLWQTDGLSLDTWAAEGPRVQCLFTVTPDTSPAFCAMRAKGRLQYALRRLGTPVAFSRRVGFRALGDNTRAIVEHYLARQALKSDYADARFKAFLDRFAVIDHDVRLASPQATEHGRYWCSLHLVLVVQDRRFPMTRDSTFTTVRDECVAIAAAQGHQLAEVAVMPDHVHLALRAHHEQAPVAVGLAFLNGLAQALGNHRCWSEEFYVGTFGEYAIGAIRG